ncbi:MAG: LacI family transcriptional regulator [Propionibacteriaceae bacterium]|jgi:LacI family transcriptional regulator|nr:LacI family transcriptional regulator [Propionibacteriaceae bacterium]
MSVTLSEVAAAAGVSLATASRALHGASGRRQVKADLKQRVLAAAERLNYTTDAMAQAVARGRTSAIGVVVHDIADPYFTALVAGVARAADAAALQVTLASTQNEPAREAELVRLLRQQRARAVILLGGRHEDAKPAELSEALRLYVDGGGTVVVVGQPLAGFDAVAIDNRGGAAALARTLHGLGYRRPAILAGPAAHLTARDRWEGFAAAFAELGDPVDPARIVHGAFTHSGGEAAFLEFARRGGGRIAADLVFAVNDVMALGALAAARDLGLAVPDDLALAGFDDITSLRDVRPGLTTVHVPLEDIGAWATELALAEEESEEESDPVVREVAVEVVLRQSTPDRPR